MKFLDFIDIKLLALLCLTLGLAPFNPPHIIGKIEWLLGGAKGMTGMDWFDLFLHGTPWIFLILKGGRLIWLRFQNN